MGAAGGTGTAANGLGASIQGDFPVTAAAKVEQGLGVMLGLLQAVVVAEVLFGVAQDQLHLLIF